MTDTPIVFSAKDGLGNRLRALVGVRALAELEQVPMVIYWEKSGACDASFEDLFERDGWENIRLIGSEENAEYKLKNPARHYHTSSWFTEIWKKHAQGRISREKFCHSAVSYLQSLKPHKDWQARIDYFSQNYDLEHFTGMHIRMTDNIHSYNWWTKNGLDFDPNKVSRVDGFISIISEMEKRGKMVFVSTDNKKLAKNLSGQFNNVVMYDKEFDDSGLDYHVRTHYGESGIMRTLVEIFKSKMGVKPPHSWRTTPIGDALVEMILLSRCSKIIGTYYSSFSQVAALMGGIPQYRMEGMQSIRSPFILEIQSHRLE